MSVRLPSIVLAALIPAAAVAAAPAPASQAAAANAVTGVWVTDGGKSHVEISRGADGNYYGKIVWLQQPAFPADFVDKALAGKPKTDYQNPDKSQRGTPLMGLVVLKNFRYQPAHDNWKGDYCYNPDNGKISHKCLLWLTAGGGKLQVRGYLGFFYETHTWNRYAAPPDPATRSTP
jgi:uncharacterized protein (DUF2147 family)